MSEKHKKHKRVAKPPDPDRPPHRRLEADRTLKSKAKSTIVFHTAEQVPETMADTAILEAFQAGFMTQEACMGALSQRAKAREAAMDRDIESVVSSPPMGTRTASTDPGDLSQTSTPPTRPR